MCALPTRRAMPCGCGVTDVARGPGAWRRHFDCKVFLLDDCDGSGRVGLVYRNQSQDASVGPGGDGDGVGPEVWFCDRAGTWCVSESHGCARTHVCAMRGVCVCVWWWWWVGGWVCMCVCVVVCVCGVGDVGGVGATIVGA